MSPRHLLTATSVLAMGLAWAAPPAAAQPDASPIQLVVEAGRTLRVALDARITITRVGQPIHGRLVEAVFAYDRIVLPAGTLVHGHVETLEPASRGARVRTILNGDFTPPRRVTLAFDTLTLRDGQAMALHTVATVGAERVVLRIADTPTRTSVAARVGRTLAEQSRQAAAVVTTPGRKERLTVALIRALPYHPLLLTKGTTYTARLLSPLAFGAVTPTTRAAADAMPAPESILRARLATAVTSSTSAAGTRLEAVLTEPVLSAEGALILPEGSRLTGEVTFSKPARRFHRHGQLRLLFDTIQPPDRAAGRLVASLQAVASPQGDHVNIDEEGGATSSSPAARFVAPTLAALALVGATHGRLDFDTDGAGPQMEYGGPSSSALGGFLGLGLFGIAVNQLGRPVTVATAAFGLTRTAYSAVFGKGRNVSFPLDTPIQVQLAPGPSAQRTTQEPR